jgi:nucleoside-triphosphatase
VGKTTLLKEALASFGGPVGGFYTEEVREGGTRLGFDIVTLEGERAPLARVGLRSPYRVSKYGVDVESLDRVGVRAIRRAIEAGGLVVVDEIGKMELFSRGFREAVSDALERGRRLLGTILLVAHPWADRLKADPRVRVVSLTRENRQRVMEEVKGWLQEAGREME